MTVRTLRVAHYLNQFFGQYGGEEQADIGFVVKPGPVGPGLALAQELGSGFEIVSTLICGDNYFAGDPEARARESREYLAGPNPDLLVAGPAFGAGRYGIACGAMCKMAATEWGIPAVTGMHVENPGVDMYRDQVFICRTGSSVRDMAPSIGKMASLARQLLQGSPNPRLVARESLPSPQEYGYFERGEVRNEYASESAATRGLNQLLAKMKGEPFMSEIVPSHIEAYAAPAPVRDLRQCVVGLVSDGGLVPGGNPDRFSGRGNLVWSTYETDAFFPPSDSGQAREVVHTGYYAEDVLEDPYRLVPIDVLRDLAAEGAIGGIYPRFFSTSGNATVAKRCAQMGAEMACEMKKTEIGAVILTST